MAAAAAAGQPFRLSRHVPYVEEPEYVRGVVRVRARYAREYARELGL